MSRTARVVVLCARRIQLHQEWLRPQNVPDITVDVDIQDFLSGRDPVLERAVETLKKN
jgi:hypothetical protein